MKYKAEVVHKTVIQGEFYFKNLSHPNQVVRNVVNKMKGKINYYLVLVINEVGDVWKYSVMKKPDNKLYVRRIGKPNYIFSADELDIIFSGNRMILDSI